MKAPNSKSISERLVPNASTIVLLLILFGLIAIFIFALQFTPEEFVSVLSVGFMTAGASLLAGGLLGFLFGIPRTSQESSRSDTIVPEGTAVASQSLSDLPQYRPNSNLEQISDWLTKILIGIGIANFDQFRQGFSTIVNLIASGLGNVVASRSFAAGILLYYLVLGFILGYIWTRIVFAGVLRLADILTRRRVREELENEIVRTREDESITDEENEEIQTTIGEVDPKEIERVAAVDERARELELFREYLSPRAYRKLARQNKRVGRYREAERAYLRAFELEPADPAPLNFAGVIRSKYLHDYKGAEELYRRAIAIDPNYLSPIYNMSCNEARRGNFRASLNLLSIAIASDNKYKELARHDIEVDAPFELLKDDPAFIRLVSDQ